MSVEGRALPGPPGIPVLGSMLTFARRGVFDTFTKLHAEYGDFARLRLPGGKIAAAIAHPDGAERILRERRHNYIKGPTYDPIRLITGTNLVTAEGAAWAWRRRLAQPAFTRAGVAKLLEAMGSCVDAMVERWARRYADGRPFDLQRELVALTMRIVGRTLFGVELAGEGAESSGRAFDAALSIVHARGAASVALPLAIPTPSNLRLRRALATLHQEVEAIIARARAGEGQDTLLSALLHARDPETGAALDAIQLRDEVIMLYLAGHETTATLLTWTFWALARAPEAMEELLAEADRSGDPGPVTPELFESLPWTRQVLQEVLRLHPPAPLVPRTVVEDDVLGGYRIPAGAHAVLHVYTLHRHPEFWESPAAFRPERFADAAISAQHRYAYLPFSAGPRTCIGNTFALWESQLALARILRRFVVELDPRAPLRLAASTIHRPAGGVTARLRSRPASDGATRGAAEPA
ncbi:MAG: cytochrome P450 [Myxococcales bacterium]|nr:cytochrome P450 [Myxococcales bacterium]